jgi:hypothetical protein
MAVTRGKCSACGAPLELVVTGMFAEAAIAGAFCPGCTDQQFLDRGGAILQLRQEPERALFPLGQVVITGGALEALADACQHAAFFLTRHARGDWGKNGHFDQIELTDDERRRGWEATEDSGKINKSNVLTCRDRVMSEYTTAHGRRLWITTRLDGKGGTIVLLPEEY